MMPPLKPRATERRKYSMAQPNKDILQGYSADGTYWIPPVGNQVVYVVSAVNDRGSSVRVSRPVSTVGVDMVFATSHLGAP
jgi:hypothetical protein